MPEIQHGTVYEQSIYMCYYPTSSFYIYAHLEKLGSFKWTKMCYDQRHIVRRWICLICGKRLYVVNVYVRITMAPNNTKLGKPRNLEHQTGNFVYIELSRNIQLFSKHCFLNTFCVINGSQISNVRLGNVWPLNLKTGRAYWPRYVLKTFRIQKKR